MIWHIFSKDCRLLWPIVCVVAAIHALSTYVRISLGLFSEPAELRTLADLLPMVAILGLVVLAATVVYQDAIPGTTQDWLVRPIRRADLLIAKLLFIVLMVHGPLFVIDFIEAIADGMPVTSSLSVALSDGFTKLCLISLPAAMLASVTNGLVGLIIAAFVCIVVSAVPMTIVRNLGNLPPPISGGGMDWIRPALMIVVAIAAAAFVLPRQYFKRTTLSSRGAIVCFGLASVFANFVPWKTGFAIQQWFTPQPGLANSVSVQYEPSLGRFQTAAGAVKRFDIIAGAYGSTLRKPVPKNDAAAVYLPLRITGIAKGSMVLMDRALLRMLDANGNELYRGTSYLSLDGQARVADARFIARRNLDGDAPIDLHQTIFIPGTVYATLGQQKLRMEIDYAMTLVDPEQTETIAAIDGEIRTANAMWCATRLDSDGDDIELRCMTPNKRASCASVILEHSPTGTRNRELRSCMPDYAPYNFTLMPFLLNHVGSNVPFLDPSGLVEYPVSGPKLAESRLILQTYEAQDHFTRQLAIPEIRLADWEAESETPRNPSVSTEMSGQH
jgi:hypothetical protein